MNQAVEIINPNRQQIADAPSAMTPMDMLNHAVSRGADITVLEKLMGLQERWEASQARKAFDAAIADAKAEIPIVGRNATGHNNRRYADFSAYAAVLRPILAKYGLSYRFRTEQTDRITVTCILSHKDGHSEESSLSGPADNSGSKNAIQAVGSTLTYLQRYTLVQALGLAAGDDDDGRTSKQTVDDGPISDEQAGIIRGLAEEVSADLAKLCDYLKVEAIPDIPARDFKRVVAMLEKKRGAK